MSDKFDPSKLAKLLDDLKDIPLPKDLRFRDVPVRVIPKTALIKLLAATVSENKALRAHVHVCDAKPVSEEKQ